MQKIDIRNLLKDPSLFKESAFINGAWVNHSAGKTFAVTNPASNDLIAEVSNLGLQEAELAITAAEQAFQDWKNRTGKERAIIMRKWFDLIIANTQDLATLMTL